MSHGNHLVIKDIPPTLYLTRDAFRVIFRVTIKMVELGFASSVQVEKKDQQNPFIDKFGGLAVSFLMTKKSFL